MKSGFAIDVTHFAVKPVTKWIIVTIVGKLCVQPVQTCCLASFVGEDYVTNALQPVDGTFPYDDFVCGSVGVLHVLCTILLFASPGAYS